MTKDEVLAAIDTIESSLSTIDFWLWVFGAIVAIGVVGEAALGIAHLLKDAKLHQLRAIESSIHETEITKLNNETVRLGTEAETARAAIAEATARAAEANRIAEGERLARVKIEAGLASRRLTDEQITKLASAFSRIKGQLSPVTFGRLGDKEAHDFATDILKAVGASKIAIELSELGSQTPPRYGLKISDTPDGLLKAAFDSAGIKVDEIIPNINAILIIFVGLKPPPF